MAGCYFNAAGAELHVYIIVGNNGNFSAYQRQNQCFPDKMGVTLIVWINRNCAVSEHCFGARGCYLDKLAVASFDRVTNVPEKIPRPRNIQLLRPTQRGDAFGTPVDNSVSAINKSFVV